MTGRAAAGAARYPELGATLFGCAARETILPCSSGVYAAQLFTSTISDDSSWHKRSPKRVCGL